MTVRGPVRLRSPTLRATRHLGLWVLALVAVACGPSSDTPRHLVLITLDTTRADHVACDGRGRAATPRLAELAATGVCFEDASTVVTTTLASHVSLMTGRPPQEHGVPENGFQVAAPNRMLAEMLADRGWETAAVLGSFALTSLVGMDQGFEHFDEAFDRLMGPGERVQNERRGRDVTDAALRIVASRDPARPLFLFVHYFDPHAPYEALEEVPDTAVDRFVGSLDDLREATLRHQRATLGFDLDGGQVDYHGLTRDMLQLAGGEPLEGDAARARRYAGEVEETDRQVGRLLDGLAEAGVLDEALVVVTADHGETFWEHGDVWNHGLGVYQTTSRVPLILWGRSLAGAGRVVGEPVSSLDVLPTVLDLLGLEGEEDGPGRSLTPATRGRSLEGQPIFVEATHPVHEALASGRVWRNEQKAQAVREGRWKFIHTPYLKLTELYDLETDPEERHDLLRDAPTPEALATARRLAALLEEWRRKANPLPSVSSKAHHEEVRQRLRSLGYF